MTKSRSIASFAIVLAVLSIGSFWKRTEPGTRPGPASNIAGPDEADSSPEASSPSATLEAAAPPQTNAAPRQKTILQRVAGNDVTVFKLPRAEVEAFVTKNFTNAESLVTAFNVTGDKEFLRQAVHRFPESPFVLASALVNNALPDQRRALVEQLKQVSPDNPLADYLSARDYLKNQQPDRALKEFAESSSKSGFHDFTVERIQGLEEMYLGAGYSPAEAKALAMAGLQLPAIPQMRELGRDMAALEKRYADAGDPASAEAVARMGLSLSANIIRSSANSLLGQMVGTIVEREFLAGLDPDRTYHFLRQPIEERLQQLQAQESAIREAAGFFDHWMHTATDAQLVSYFDRLKLYGEAAAIEWARTQSPDLATNRE